MILLVEDNPADANLVREALEKHEIGCDLFLVTNGERAIQFIESAEAGEIACPDLVILDLNLPKKSGSEVLERFRASSKCSRMPIAILTSSDSQLDKDVTAALGASAYFRKPSRLAEFLELGTAFKQLLAK